MPPDLRLGYLVFEARRPARWIAFCQHMLGLSDPAGWETQHTDVTSAWGHKPKLRLQLKMAPGLIAQKVSGAPRQAKELA